MGYSLAIRPQFVSCIVPSTSLAPLVATHDFDMLVIQVRKTVKNGRLLGET